MSYHETYEFFAIDQCLTPTAMRALRVISSRATITPARFYNSYDWGGLKGDPHEMLRRYFDLFVHTGNGRPDWGMLRFPANIIDQRRWRPYVAEQRGARPSGRCASVVMAGNRVILSITPCDDAMLHPIDGTSPDEDDGWLEDEIDETSMDESGWPVPLALVRADLLAGDLRPLYFLWLLSVQRGERRATVVEPPRPPGLERLTGSLYRFAEFLQLNADFLAVGLDADPEPRTVKELLSAAAARAAQRHGEAVAQAAATRRKRLKALAKRQAGEWSDIDRLLGEPKVKPSIYQDAVRRLTELQELAIDRGAQTDFRKQLHVLLEHHWNKAAFRRRVREASLLGSEELGEGYLPFVP